MGSWRSISGGGGMGGGAEDAQGGVERRGVCEGGGLARGDIADGQGLQAGASKLRGAAVPERTWLRRAPCDSMLLEEC